MLKLTLFVGPMFLRDGGRAFMMLNQSFMFMTEVNRRYRNKHQRDHEDHESGLDVKTDVPL